MWRVFLFGGDRVIWRVSSGRSAAWLAHQTGGLGVAGSNPVAPIYSRKKAARRETSGFLLLWQGIRREGVVQFESEKNDFEGYGKGIGATVTPVISSLHSPARYSSKEVPP